jgi:hypothetical protein
VVWIAAVYSDHHHTLAAHRRDGVHVPPNRVDGPDRHHCDVRLRLRPAQAYRLGPPRPYRYGVHATLAAREMTSLISLPPSIQSRAPRDCRTLSSHSQGNRLTVPGVITCFLVLSSRRFYVVHQGCWPECSLQGRDTSPRPPSAQPLPSHPTATRRYIVTNRAFPPTL